MADYCTHFSVVVDLPDVAAQQYALALITKINSLTDPDEVPDDIPEALHHYLEEWNFETERSGSPPRPGLWLHSENGGVDAACSFIQHLLKKFTPNDHLAFEWSNDCSKPRTDAYGGGAAFITATEIQSMSTWEWVIEKTKQCSQPL